MKQRVPKCRKHVRVELARESRIATLLVQGPNNPAPVGTDAAQEEGDTFWPLTVARELEDAILHLRFNEPTLGLLLLRTHGDAERMLAYDAFLARHQDHWLIREIRHYLKRVLKRLDVTARSLVALIEPGSCFAGTLAELAFAADRSMMLIGRRDGDNQPAAALVLSEANFSHYPMGNGLTRLATRFLGEPESLERARAKIGQPVEAEEADALGLVTSAIASFDWDDAIRLMGEERLSFSPDALTGMEANLRFAGPETIETKIFGRLTAWQNWIFQRPNSVGTQGALTLYGSGIKPTFDRDRV